MHTFVKMEALNSFTAQIKSAAATANEAERKRILDSLRELQYSIEKPEDTMQRVIHLVSSPEVQVLASYC